jgi:hypothetical protein
LPIAGLVGIAHADHDLARAQAPILGFAGVLGHAAFQHGLSLEIALELPMPAIGRNAHPSRRLWQRLPVAVPFHGILQRFQALWQGERFPSSVS